MILIYGTDSYLSKMRNIFAAFCIQLTLGCDSKCLEKRLEVLERRYDADLNFQELTRAAHEEFDDKIETIMVNQTIKRVKASFRTLNCKTISPTTSCQNLMILSSRSFFNLSIQLCLVIHFYSEGFI